MVNRVERASIPKLVIGMRVKERKALSGFTLIEILVVLLIIGITLGFALLAFGDFGEKRRIIAAADQFSQYVKLVQQQAILETSTLGIQFTKDGYDVLRLQMPNKWQPTPTKGIFHPQHFPAFFITRLDKSKTQTGQPDIIVNATGDLTPFQLHFGSKKSVFYATVIGKQAGVVELKIVNSP